MAQIKEELEALRGDDGGNVAEGSASGNGGSTSGKKAESASGELRSTTDVAAEKIKAHLNRLVTDSTAGKTDDRVARIRALHSDLIYWPEEQSVPTQEPDHPPNTHIQLSTPPGLRNLGATCYLNSQLQCLSQNLGFADGLFMWRRPGPNQLTVSGNEDRMDNVIDKMQKILGQMRAGGEGIICTEEFAKALNLENGEMQDPNEVSTWQLLDCLREACRSSRSPSLICTN